MGKKKRIPFILLSAAVLELLVACVCALQTPLYTKEGKEGISLALDLITMMTTIVVLFSCYLSWNQGAKESKSYNILLFSLNTALFFDVLLYCTNHKQQFASVTLVMGYLYITISIIMMAGFYQIVCATHGGNKVLDRIMKVVTLIAYLTIAGNTIYPYLFYVDPQGNYCRADSYARVWVSLLVVLWICILIKISVKKMTVVERITYCFYVILPICCFLIQEVFHTATFQYVGMQISLLLYHVNIYSRNEIKHMKQEELLARQQIQLMTSQIQPHFIFNALSSIRELCNEKETADLILDFSNYLRMNLETLGSTNLVSFQKEMEHTRQYVRIELLRFGDRLNVEYDLQEEMFRIPPLTVQPIVENAIKHGICEKVDGGTVKVASRREAGYYVIEIQDDGVGFIPDRIVNNTNDTDDTDDRKKHTGIENVRTRIKELSHGEMVIHSEKGHGTLVRIMIPEE